MEGNPMKYKQCVPLHILDRFLITCRISFQPYGRSEDLFPVIIAFYSVHAYSKYVRLITCEVCYWCLNQMIAYQRSHHIDKYKRLKQVYMH